MTPYHRYRQWAIKVLTKDPWQPQAYRCLGCGPGYVANPFIAGDVIPRARCKGCGCAIEMWRPWTRCYHVQPGPDTGKRRRCNTVHHLHLSLLPLVYHFGLAGV